MTKPHHDIAAKPSVQVLERMFTLLDVLASREEAVSLKELSEITGLERDAASAIADLPLARRDTAAVRDLRRLLAEFRVALFAQPMKTAIPVSAKRFQAAIAALR